jgi:hypothetical protein
VFAKDDLLDCREEAALAMEGEIEGIEVRP